LALQAATWGTVRRTGNRASACGDMEAAAGVVESMHSATNAIRTDHGHQFRTRNSEHKRSCHDASICIPGMLHGGPFSGGGQVSQLVSLIDLPYTLLDAVALPRPAAMQGRSILPLLRGASAAWPEEVYAQISESQVARAIRTQRWKYGVRADSADGNQAPGAAA
jgi:arylsulfatase A-like enzyme